MSDQVTFQVSNLSSPPSFLLSPNPLLCDCSLEWLLPSSSTSSSSSSLNQFNSVASLSRAAPGPLIADRSSLSCSPHLPHNSQSSPIPLMKVILTMVMMMRIIVILIPSVNTTLMAITITIIELFLHRFLPLSSSATTPSIAFHSAGWSFLLLLRNYSITATKQNKTHN